MNEMLEALGEAIGMYLTDNPDTDRVTVTQPGSGYALARPTVEVQGMRILVEA